MTAAMARGDRLTADAVGLQYDPVAEQARRIGARLAFLDYGGSPGFILRQLLRRGIPKVAQPAAVNANIDRDLTFKRSDDVGG